MRRRQYLQRTNRVASAPEPDRQAPIHLSPGFGELLHLDDPYSNRCFARQLNKTELIRNSDPAIRWYCRNWRQGRVYITDKRFNTPEEVK
jgi:hypothetical protein